MPDGRALLVNACKEITQTYHLSNICSEHSLRVIIAIGGKRFERAPRTEKHSYIPKARFPSAVSCNTEQGFFFQAAADACLNIWAASPP